MKSSLVVLSLSQLLILFSSFTAIARPIKDLNSGGNLPVVIDSIYKDLKFNNKYFFADSLLGGGGVSRGPNNLLVQTTNTVDYGISVVFKPMQPTTQEEITESIPLNILFTDGDNDNTVWKVEGLPETSGPPYFLSSNGVAGNTKDVSTWFQIKKVSYFSYKLVFCPFKLACRDVGFVEDDGKRRLAVTAGVTNFPIVFVLDKPPCVGKSAIYMI